MLPLGYIDLDINDVRGEAIAVLGIRGRRENHNHGGHRRVKFRGMPG